MSAAHPADPRLVKSMAEDKGVKWHNIEMYGVTWILSGANYRFINNNMRARDANTVQIQLQLLPIQKQIILFTINTCLGLVLYGYHSHNPSSFYPFTVAETMCSMNNSLMI